MRWVKLAAAAVISTVAGVALGGWLAEGTAFPSGVNILVFYGAMLFGVPALVALAVARPRFNLGTGALAGAAGACVATLAQLALSDPSQDMGSGYYWLGGIWLLLAALLGAAVGAMACGIAGARRVP